LAGPPLLLAGDAEPGVVRVGQLHAGVDHGAAPGLQPFHPRLQRVEHGQRPLARAARGGGLLADPGPPAPVPLGQVGGDQRVLGAEPVVDGLLGDPGLLGDELHADGVDAPLVEEPGRGVQHPAPGRGERPVRSGGGHLRRLASALVESSSGDAPGEGRSALRVYRPVWLLGRMFRSLPLPRTAPTALLGAGLVATWSSGFIGAELGTGEASATTLLAWRFIAVTALLGGWALLRRPRIPPRELALHAAIGALAQAGYLYGVVAAAEHRGAAATSALIAALQPLAAAALAAPLLGERVTPRRAGGLALGLAGVALVVGSDLSAGGAAPAWAFLLPFAAMLSLVAASVLERRTRPRASVADALTV